ncbi:MAG: DUF6279 family lipoprotein [Betaproteobacteria bacterium]|nr:DUF6279 family lipoprotein [Betaproteobacteria bacterium]
MRPPIRLRLLILVILLLAGCSAVRLGYGNADSLARWWIDQYLDLAPEQDVLVRERLGRYFAWHRKTQLPDYVNLLRQGRKLATGQTTAADALALGDELIRRGRILAEQATPDIADLLPTLTPAQIERMAARQTEKNTDYAREAKLAEGEAGQRKARYKRLLERAEYWFGDFSREQEAALRRMVDAQDPGSQFWYEERLRRQRDWISLVRQVQRERPPRERVIQMLRDYATRFDLPTEPARLAQAIALRHASAELAVAIHALMTPSQREHARSKLDDLIHDFTQLSRAE